MMFHKGKSDFVFSGQIGTAAIFYIIRKDRNIQNRIDSSCLFKYRRLIFTTGELQSDHFIDQGYGFASSRFLQLKPPGFIDKLLDFRIDFDDRG